MNIRSEHEFSFPEVPKISPEKEPRPVDIVIDQAEAPVTPSEIRIDDHRQAKHILLELAAEPILEQKLEFFHREIESILGFTEKVTAMRVEAEAGMHRTTWDVVEAFEVDSRGVSDDLPMARRNFHAFVDRLREIEAQGDEQKVFRAITKKFIADTAYRVNKNSLVEAMAENEDGEMNCNSRFKGIAAALEELGYSPENQIFVVEYADHYKAIVPTKYGYTALDGDQPESYEIGEEGTAVMPLNDYKRTLLGLPAEHRQVYGEQRELHAVKESFLKRTLDRWFPSPADAVGDRRAGTELLKSNDPLNLSRFAHLIPPSVLPVLRSQLLVSANSALSRDGDSALKRAKAVASWRSSKLALGGSIAMAMYSACGPTVEKYSSAKSSDEAADLIHEDLEEMRAVFAEKVDQVAQAVEKVFELHAEEQKPEEKIPAVKTSGTAKGQSWDSVVDQMPIPNIKMTKEEVYFLLAEQELTYGAVDFALEHGQEKKEDVGRIAVDAGDAYALDPSFWKAMIRRGVKHIEQQELREGFVIHLDIQGAQLSKRASRAALDAAWDELEQEYNKASGERYTPDWARVHFYATINGEIFLSEKAGAFAFRRDENSDIDLDWRVVLGGVQGDVIIAKAQNIAKQMGEPDVVFDITHDYLRAQNTESYHWHLAQTYRMAPIGFIEFSDGKTNDQPIFSEMEKESMFVKGRTTFRPISAEQKADIEDKIQFLL